MINITKCSATFCKPANDGSQKCKNVQARHLHSKVRVAVKLLASFCHRRFVLIEAVAGFDFRGYQNLKTDLV